MVVARAGLQVIPTLTTLTPQNAAQEVQKAHLGSVVSKVEAQWVNDVYSKFGSDPAVVQALQGLLSRVSNTSVDKVGGNLTTIRAGQLLGGGGAPVAQTAAPIARPVPAAVAHLVKDPDGPGGVDVGFATRKQQGDTALLQKGSDLFKGFLDVNVGKMLADAAQQNPALAPLAQALDKDFVIETPHNQYYKTPGKLGNDVLFYDDNHTQLKEVLHAMKDDGMFIKTMMHYEQSHTRGDASVFFQGDRAVMGSTHTGAVIPVVNEKGEKEIAWMDWPVDYGRLPGGEGTYAGRLGVDSIDNLKFQAPLPGDWDKQKGDYLAWQRTATVLAMITVPFASDDDRQWNSNYKFNILEVKDGAAASDFISTAAQPNTAATTAKVGLLTQYCREGVATSINAREAVPQSLSAEAQKALKDAQAIFDKALVGISAHDLPRSYHKGWAALEASGYISSSQMDILKSTHAVHVPFQAPTNIAPISTYKPEGIGDDKLAARPLHMGNLVGGILEVDFDRKRTGGAMSKQLQEAVAQAMASGGPQAAGAILGGAAGVAGMNPQDAADPAKHARIIQEFGEVMAANLSAGIVQKPEMQQMIKNSLAFHYLDSTSQTRVQGLIDAYVALIKNAPNLDDADFQKQRKTLDKKAEMTQVTYGPPIDRTDAMMKFIPPQYEIFAALGVAGTSSPGYQPIAEMMPEAWQK